MKKKLWLCFAPLYLSLLLSAQVKQLPRYKYQDSSISPFATTTNRPQFIDCNNWLSTPSLGSYVEVGELDVPGNTITVEGMFNRTTPYAGGFLYAGDIVSKHNSPADCNYLLRPNEAEITTSDGYFRTPEICEIDLNKTYHVAFVYDGSTLKFYRNGYLMSQTPASGDLFQNSWKTRIGWFEPQTFVTNLIGYINEVRIWNVARTQSEIQTYMNSSLPSPTTQPGLLAYYTFDNLQNKQGNPLYNGTLSGAASINATNTSCNYIADSCRILPVTPDSSIIINTYTPVIALDLCKNFLTVEDASTFNVGDTVLMIQMKGAEIDSSNTAAFGSITQLNNAGNYEFNYVKSKTGNQIELLNALTRQYDLPNGFVQLIRVPYFESLVVTDTLTCLPWDGRKGGVLAFLVKDTLELNNNIDVTGKGFKGGRVVNTGLNSTNCFTNDYFYPNPSLIAAPKGESIANISSNIASGKGASASGGGGGLDHNSGGGGGGNATDGGLGGWQLQECGNFPFDNRGIGGKGIPYSNAQNKIFMGGGGGAGHCNNDFSAAGNSNFNGGNGGGIVIASTNFFKSNNYQILARGDSAYELNAAISDAHDGMGGGGAGGTILLAVNQYIDPVNINNAGGKGGDMHAPLTGGHIGPGGGGAGGVAWFNQPSIPATATVITNGGRNGYLLLDNNNPFGATSGNNGIQLFNLVLPIDVVPFKKNIDSARINPIQINCDSFQFNGLAYVNLFPISQWQWNFGDGGAANGQNTTHTYSDSGTYTIKLVVTDVNGCKDSTQTQVRVQVSSIDFTYDQLVCNPLSVQFNGFPNTGLSPIFILGDGNTVTGNINPLYNYAQAGNYTVQFILNNNGCVDTLTKLIRIAVVDSNIIVTRDTSICPGSTLPLSTIPSLDFCWSPTTYLNNPGLANPITSTPVNITYHFTARVLGNNLISNGNFSNGNTGFSSDYSFVSNNTTEGEYFVGPNPQAWNGGVSPCPDHTSGSGNMMMVNGSPVINQTIWKQTVSVTPNTLYAFSTWIQSVSANNPANLQFAINGVAIGQPIAATVPTCNWARFYTTWNAGNQATAVISIINKNTQVQGNDFALDDIQFATLTYYTDSVRIRIDSPFVHAGNDTSVCSKTNLQLHATGSSGGTVIWNNGITLSDSTSLNPILTVKDTTAYIISLVSGAGCRVSDTVMVNALPGPTISTSNDTTVCLRIPVPLSASGGLTYLWTPAGSLTGANTDHPIALASDTTTYSVTVTGINGCSDTASVRVNVQTLERFGVTPTVKTCVHVPGQLNATGGTSYLWFPSHLVSDSAIANPFTNDNFPANSNVLYTVRVVDSVCSDTAYLQSRLAVLGTPSVKLRKTNDIDCTKLNAILVAQGGIQYVWTPKIFIAGDSTPTPLVYPSQTMQYYLSAIDSATGCKAFDSIKVNVQVSPNPQFQVPNAFTPNGDGYNDCFRIKRFGYIRAIRISVFDRWGNRVFSTENENDCWDGFVNGTPADPGNFVYIIEATNECTTSYTKGNLLLLR